MREGPGTDLPGEEPEPTPADEPTEEMDLSDSSAPGDESRESDVGHQVSDSTSEPTPAAEDAVDEGGPTDDEAPSNIQTEAPSEDEPASEAEEEAASSDGKDAEPEPVADADEQPAEEVAESAEAGEEDLLPPGISAVELPLIGAVPLWLLGAVAGLGTLVFSSLFLLGLRSWRSAPAAPPPPAAVSEEGEEPLTPPPEPLPAEKLAAMDYESLIDAARDCMSRAEYAAAAQLAREAASREEEGIARVLLAREILARALTELGHYKEALRLSESLRAVSRPGDELWKHALITSITCVNRQERWKELYRYLCLLRANSARYGDEAVLNRWLAYNRAMVRVRLYLEMTEGGRRLYGTQPPPLGRAPCNCRPLAEHDIVVVTGKYGDGSVEVDFSVGDLDLRAEGADLAAVLRALEQETGLEIRQAPPGEHVVSARLKAVAPEHALEMVLGAVGFQADVSDGVARVGELDPRPESAAEARRDALWSAQEFLILYPESVNVAEAYYALGHLYMLDGHTAMALDQLEILCSQYPRSSWAAHAHYVAGRTFYEQKNWEAAERELLLLTDGSPGHRLAPSAYLWAAQSQVKMQKYAEAVGCFRRALAHEANEPMEVEILYNIAYCMEKSGISPLEVEERYLELRTRFPSTPFARRADYRLARMALDDGRYRTAAARYEFFLSNWPIDSEQSPAVCRDLVFAYLHAGEHIRAVMLGEVMASTFGRREEYWQALPGLLEACRQCALNEIAVEMLDRALAVAEEPRRRASLIVQKAGFLMDMDKYEAAGAALASIEGQSHDGALAERAALCRARLALARDPARGIEVCRRLATGGGTEEVRTEALRLMGRHYRRVGRFDRAALIYSGKCPVEEETGS
ncbi:MAG: tetratricopeptide repeat protein [Candidatus Brocadiia bacterium]